MKTSPITWVIIRILTRRGKRHVKELHSNCARAGELNRELLMRIVHDNRDTSFMFSVFMTNLVDMMVYIQRNWEMLVEDIRTGTFNEEIKIDDQTRAELMKVTRPEPKRAAELEAEFRKGFNTPIIPRLWPKMSFISTIGTGGFAACRTRR